MHGTFDFQTAWMERRVSEARGMFNRVLVSWAGDVLELRRTSRLVPSWSDATSASDRQGGSPFEPMNDAA